MSMRPLPCLADNPKSYAIRSTYFGTDPYGEVMSLVFQYNTDILLNLINTPVAIFQTRAAC